MPWYQGRYYSYNEVWPEGIWQYMTEKETGMPDGLYEDLSLQEEVEKLRREKEELYIRIAVLSARRGYKRRMSSFAESVKNIDPIRLYIYTVTVCIAVATISGSLAAWFRPTTRRFV